MSKNDELLSLLFQNNVDSTFFKPGKKIGQISKLIDTELEQCSDNQLGWINAFAKVGWRNRF